MAALHLASRVFLAGKHISDERARENRPRNFRNLTEESLERSRGRRRRENFNEEHRKAERKVSFQGL